MVRAPIMGFLEDYGSLYEFPSFWGKFCIAVVGLSNSKVEGREISRTSAWITKSEAWLRV